MQEPNYSTLGSQDQKRVQSQQASALSSYAQMPKVVRIKKGDSSLVGISKAYQTGTTAITSNHDNMSITQAGAGLAQPLFGSDTQTEILNYPYAYD